MKMLTCALLLLVAVFGVRAQEHSQSRVPPSKQKLTLTIYPHGYASFRTEHSYLANEPVLIRCVWKNTGKKSATFLLDDHDDYHGTQSYPAWVQARVRDKSGSLLTKREGAEDGFWSSNYLSSDSLEESPGDSITLKPGEDVTRIIPLDKMLLGVER